MIDQSTCSHEDRHTGLGPLFHTSRERGLVSFAGQPVGMEMRTPESLSRRSFPPRRTCPFCGRRFQFSATPSTFIRDFRVHSCAKSLPACLCHTVALCQHLPRSLGTIGRNWLALRPWWVDLHAATRHPQLCTEGTCDSLSPEHTTRILWLTGNTQSPQNFSQAAAAPATFLSWVSPRPTHSSQLSHFLLYRHNPYHAQVYKLSPIPASLKTRRR